MKRCLLLSYSVVLNFRKISSLFESIWTKFEKDMREIEIRKEKRNKTEKI
jgi:hypothetical protein